MKKKIAKISVLICTLALVLTVIFALAACESGTKYTYSSTKVETSGDYSDLAGSMNDSMKTMYDTMYKDSTITVSDSKIVWTISDAKSEMTVEKDGDKYVLSGEYVDQMKTALSSGMASGGVEVSFDMYGVKTDSGFDIVMSVSSTVSAGGTSITSGSTLTISFV